MPKRPLKVETALRALPEVDDLSDLRQALIGASREDGERAWSGAEAYATLDTRLADPAALEAQVPALAERARARVEAVMRHAVRALRALEAGDAAEAARALADAGEVEEEAGRLDEAERLYRQALAQGRKPRDRSGEGLALRRLGRVARQRGDLEAALRLYRDGFDIASAQRDTPGAVVACQGLGNVYVDQGLWEKAREWYLGGIGLLAGEVPGRALWQLYSNLAVVELRTGRLDESGRWLDRAEEVAARLADPAARAPVWNGRGRLAMARGRPREAEEACRRALEGELAPYARGTVLVNLAEALLAQGRTPEAEGVARTLEATAVVHGVIPLLPYVYRTLGAVARERGDAEGFVFYEQALDACRERGMPPLEMALTQHEYALFEAAQGRAEPALARLDEARAVYRKLGTAPETARAEADRARIEAEAGTEDPVPEPVRG